MFSPFKFPVWDPILGVQELLRHLESWLEMPSPGLWGRKGRDLPQQGAMGEVGRGEVSLSTCQSQVPVKPCLLSRVPCCTSAAPGAFGVLQPLLQCRAVAQRALACAGTQAWSLPDHRPRRPGCAQPREQQP